MNVRRGYDPMEIASIASNTAMGCLIYLDSIKKKKELDKQVIQEYFKGSEELIKVLIDAYETGTIKRLIGDLLRSDTIVKKMLPELKKAKEVLEKIRQGCAEEEEVEICRKTFDKITWLFLNKSHAMWLEELRRYVPAKI